MHQSPTVVFELRRRDTGSLVHAYATEGAALAFVRDVIFIGGRDQAACFALEVRDELARHATGSGCRTAPSPSRGSARSR